MNLSIGLLIESPLVEPNWSNATKPGFLYEITEYVCKGLKAFCEYYESPLSNATYFDNEALPTLMNDVRDKVYDTAIPYFTPVEPRMEIVDFSDAVFLVKLLLVIRRPSITFSFRRIMTLQWNVWLCLLLSAILVGTVISLSSRHRKGRGFFVNNFTNVFDSVSMFLAQTQNMDYSTMTSRIVITFWAVTALITAAVYSGNLMAFLSSAKPTYPFVNFHTFVDCMERGECKLVSKSINISYIDLLYQSTFEKYRKSADILRHTNQQLIIPNQRDIVDMIRNTKPYYLVWLVDESTYLQETNGNVNCSFFSIDSGLLDVYAFPFPKHQNQTVKKFNKIIFWGRQTGTFQKIYNSYVYENACFDGKNKNDNAEPLHSSAIYGFAAILSVGYLISGAALLIEKWKWNKVTKTIQPNACKESVLKNIELTPNANDYYHVKNRQIFSTITKSNV